MREWDFQYPRIYHKANLCDQETESNQYDEERNGQSNPRSISKYDGKVNIDGFEHSTLYRDRQLQNNHGNAIESASHTRGTALDRWMELRSLGVYQGRFGEHLATLVNSCSVSVCYLVRLSGIRGNTFRTLVVRLGGGHSNSKITSGSSTPKRNNRDVCSGWERGVGTVAVCSGLGGWSGRDMTVCAGWADK